MNVCLNRALTSNVIISRNKRRFSYRSPFSLVIGYFIDREHIDTYALLRIIIPAIFNLYCTIVIQFSIRAIPLRITFHGE